MATKLLARSLSCVNVMHFMLVAFSESETSVQLGVYDAPSPWLLRRHFCVRVIGHFWATRSKLMQYLVLTYRVHRERTNAEVRALHKHKWASHCWLLNVSFRALYELRGLRA